MQGSIQTYQTPDCRHGATFEPDDNGIGDLFREYGEQYIRSYKPNLTQIKLIRSIRICKTPALGGKRYTCKGCGQRKYVYFGCGNSRCPKCQGIKRMQWQDKLSNKIFKVPYQHIVFTLPGELRSLARSNPWEIYSCLFRASWLSLLMCTREESNLGGKPGAIMVLHTFGSDIKYHVHIHALVTFGGLTSEGQWVWPKRKKKIVAYRQMRNKFREIFLKELSKIYETLKSRISYEELEKELKKKSWCVHAEPPTTNTKIIEEYLGKYICRIGLSKKRFKYDKIHKEVTLSYKDYRSRKSANLPAPMAIRKLNPLVAIDQIMAHCLPLYFQKCRYYGLHASATNKKVNKLIPEKIKNESTSIRTVFQIIKAMLDVEEIACKNCNHTEFNIQVISADRRWIKTWLTIPDNRGSPDRLRHITSKRLATHGGHTLAMPTTQKKRTKSV